MRGNKTIDYEQIGLKFRLYSCGPSYINSLERWQMQENGIV